jgi:hypothetical protein
MNNNISSDQIQSGRNLLQSAKSIIIAIPDNPNFDTVAASLSLYLSLSINGKQVSVICPSLMIVEFNHLVGIDKIGSSINGGSGKNLVISFPYQEGSIEKVSYNIENDTFNLVIEPREGYPVISQDMIMYSQSGGNIDMIITINVPILSDLKNLYSNNQSIFHEKPIINISSRTDNTQYGKINISNPNSSSVSELTVDLLSHLGLSMDADIATNLLAGISSGSNNYSSEKTTAATFEASAICLRNGAKKIITSDNGPLIETQQKNHVESFQPLPTSQQLNYTPINKPFTPFMQKKPFSPLQPQKPTKTQIPETPPDWLKPKIYKGSSLL